VKETVECNLSVIFRDKAIFMFFQSIFLNFRPFFGQGFRPNELSIKWVSVKRAFGQTGLALK
jgi:hypothetical protein